jgi:DNA-binding transcriptional ArsR family regulator
MTKSNGLFVFTATPEMAQANPRLFRAGETYTVQRADKVIEAARPSAKRAASAGSKKVSKKITKTLGKKKAAKASAPKPALKTGKVKSGKRAASPEVVVQFVRDNDGCNMTQIEASTKMAQPAIRKALNDARDAGLIRTEGQRRGLRYYATTATAAPAKAEAEPAASGSTPW